MVGSALLPGERLRPHHVIGALLGFGGILVLKGFDFSGAYMTGYLAALACAFTWATYSLATRRFGEVSTDVVTGFCLATSVLSALCHLGLEENGLARPDEPVAGHHRSGADAGRRCLLCLDHGVKNGDIRILGVASYAAPILSTLVLVVAGFAEASTGLLLACVMVAGGALIASSDRLFGRAATRTP